MCLFVSWDSCKIPHNRWITMEGSSESGWQRSDSIRGGANSSSFSGRNPRILRGTNVRSLGDNTSHDSPFLPARKGRDQQITVLPHTSNDRTGAGDHTEEAETVLVRGIEPNDVSLRQWLDNPERKVDALECLHIFSQVADIVSMAHSQGIVVHNVRPSCFVMSSLNRVSFIESASCSDSGSESPDEHGSHEVQTAELKGFDSSMPTDSYTDHHSQSNLGVWASQSGKEGIKIEQKQSFPMKHILLMESSWYTSPEEISGGSCSCASDIYQLGVLLFELYCTFGTMEEKSTTMANLRHRVLPPQLLLKWPKEASFCLWLLHPEPSNRPKMSELLQSAFLNEPKNDIEEREAAIDLRDEIEEQELLLEFLLRLQQKKQEVADGLNETMSIISSDVNEVTNLQQTLRIKGNSGLDLNKNLASDEDDSGFSGSSRKRVRQGVGPTNSEESEGHGNESQERSILSQNPRLMKNFRKLESAYFLTRRRALKPAQRPSNRHSQISTENRGASERSLISNASLRRNEQKKQGGWINTFLEGLCKYLSYSRLEVKADLRQGDLLNSSNLVCSVSFDRDGEFFATAGVNKKIKVFDYSSILNEVHDINYPVVEMSSRSKLSSICWNGYIKSQIASSNFEGTVQVWDVTRSQVFKEMREHGRRVWSVDFSLADPTLLASGSDDGSVKLWNINQGTSVGTIKTKANVCCVQFPTDSGRSLAFGSADHRIYYYDLRNTKMPLCTLVGHSKTVSYVKFIDSTTLVSASTDNTLKLWDLSMSTSQVLDCPLQSYTGHLNIKNFVGLSVSDGYIATGSETNEVFVYHKAFSMPVLSFKFSGDGPNSGDDVDGSTQFISSVCWRGHSTSLVAANSMGNIKVLDMA